ncbi:DUF4209 domain-containing protein [Chloroflexota bacterium]
MNEEEKTPELIFREYEEDTVSQYPHQWADKIGQAIPLLEAQGREDEKQQAVWESALCWLHVRHTPEERRRLGGRFGPMMTQADGSQLPDPVLFTDDALDYYARRADMTSNPIHRARYCDFLWEKRHDHNFALKAIDAYLKCLPIYLTNSWYLGVADSLSRSIELALMLNDERKIEKTRESLMLTMDELVVVGNHPALRYCLDLIDALLSTKERAKVPDLQKAVGVCKKGVVFYASEEGGFTYPLARDFEERQAALWQRLDNEKERGNAQIRIGELFEKEAELKGGSSNMLGAIFLQQAAQHYANIGRRDKVEELKIKVKQRWNAAVDGGEFKRIETRVRFPIEQIAQYAQNIVNQGMDKALLTISLDLNLVPDVKECRKRVGEQKLEFPLFGLVPRIRVQDGRQIVSASDQEEIDEENALSQYSADLGFRRLYLGKVFEIMREQLDLNAASFLDYLSTSPFFDKDKLDVIRIGVERYFDGDYVSAIHILVPHLEDTLRHILGRLGVSTTSLKPRGVTHEKMPDKVLDTPELRALLGKRVWFYFKYVLIHPLGQNLRHDVAHGLINRERCTKELTETVLHLFLRLSPYQVKNQTANT